MGSVPPGICTVKSYSRLPLAGMTSLVARTLSTRMRVSMSGMAESSLLCTDTYSSRTLTEVSGYSLSAPMTRQRPARTPPTATCWASSSTSILQPPMPNMLFTKSKKPMLPSLVGPV